MRIGVLGTGYVGLVTGLCLSQFGNDVVCMDIDRKKIARLRKGELPIYEPSLDGILKRGLQRKTISFSDDPAGLDFGFDVIFFAVGTPATPDGGADLTAFMAAVEAIATRLRRFTVIAVKSTVPVGTGAAIARRIGTLNPAARFAVVSNPEFLREGSAVADFLEPDRIVVGADQPQAAAVMRRVYHPLIRKGAPFKVTSVATSELIKYASNGFLATKLAFINEMANLCEAMGANVEDLSEAMGLDARIGPAFLKPGPGFGGSCFPKDIQALAAQAQQSDCPSRILEAVVAANAHQVRRQARRIEQLCRTCWQALDRDDLELDGKVVALLGLAFKADTDDVRYSPALAIARQLVERGAWIQAYDPEATAQAEAIAPSLDYCASAEEALTGADCAIIATEWPQFAKLDWSELRPLMEAPIVVDLRNLLGAERMRAWGFLYHPLGQAAEEPASDAPAEDAPAEASNLTLVSPAEATARPA